MPSLATGWIWASGFAIEPGNAHRVTQVLHDASFDQANVGDFREARKVGRMGVPPLRLEIITSASGVEFPDHYSLRLELLLDEVRVPLIHLDNLKRNKAPGRRTDHLDLQELP